MAFVDKYPYTDFHELNLDWVLKKIKEIDKTVTDFTVFNKLTWAGVWSAAKSYVKWSIVQDENGNGYISIQPVPINVPLTNTNYWIQIAKYEELYAAFDQRITSCITYLDTVADLINYNGEKNQLVRTKGYYYINDGGGAYYNLESEQSSFSIPMNNGLFAVMIKEPINRIEQFGAKGDGTDNTNLIITALNNSDFLELSHGKTYTSTGGNPFALSNKKIIGNGATISGGLHISTYFGNISNFIIENVNFNTQEDYSIRIQGDTNHYASGVVIDGCTFNSSKFGIGVFNDDRGSTRLRAIIKNCNFESVKSVAIQQSSASTIIDNCIFPFTGSENITIDNGSNNCSVKNCELKSNNAFGAIGIDEASYISINNNKFTGSDINSTGIKINSLTGAVNNIIISSNKLINLGNAIQVGSDNSILPVTTKLNLTGNTFTNCTHDIFMAKYSDDTSILSHGNSFSSGFFNITNLSQFLSNSSFDSVIPANVTPGENVSIINQYCFTYDHTYTLNITFRITNPNTAGNKTIAKLPIYVLGSSQIRAIGFDASSLAVITLDTVMSGYDMYAWIEQNQTIVATVTITLNF